MTRVSSDWTLFLKLFLPTVWIVFFGVVEVVLIFNRMLPPVLIAGTMVCYVIGLLVLYATLLRLKRVECTEEHLYVTNYFRTYRYTYDSIASTRKTSLGIADLVKITFNARTTFGKSIYFVKRPKVWEEQGIIHPELANQGWS